jgi:citrate lyase beta subunit
VADSAAAGVRPPFDRVFPGRGDPEGLEADCRFARSTGFGGKGCTHVGQPAVVNRVFGERPGRASKAALFEP